MLPRASLAAVLACSALIAGAQTADPNLQNLLGALTNGTEVTMGTPLTPGASYTAGASAAAGGTAPPSARELALQQLAGIGIINPSEDQIRTAIIGGTLTTVNGVVQLPGVLAR